MLINLSNHPYPAWDKKQKTQAEKIYGSVVDLNFPVINPEASTAIVRRTAREYFEKITRILDECANEPYENAVHVMGEFTFVCNLVRLLKQSGINCVASTTHRNVSFSENGEKIVKFEFVQFRKY